MIKIFSPTQLLHALKPLDLGFDNVVVVGLNVLDELAGVVSVPVGVDYDHDTEEATMYVDSVEVKNAVVSLVDNGAVAYALLHGSRVEPVSEKGLDNFKIGGVSLLDVITYDYKNLTWFSDMCDGVCCGPDNQVAIRDFSEDTTRVVTI